MPTVGVHVQTHIIEPSDMDKPEELPVTAEETSAAS